MAMLSQDTTQIKMEVEKTKVVALVVSGQGGAQCYHTKVGQYYSTKENLMALAVQCQCQNILLVCEVGVGNTRA